MSWKFVGDAKGLTPLAGIPLECEDADFEAAVAAYESQFNDEQKGAVVASGLYEHTKGKLQATQPEQPSLVEQPQASSEVTS